MAASSKTKFEVVLNAAASGLTEGDHIKEVSATRFHRDVGSNSVTFYDGDDEVAFFQHPVSVTKKS